MKLFDNTRIGAFRTCPRKFYLRHVRHFTPDRTSAPLVFGSAWHNGMDALWGSTHKGRNDQQILDEASQAFLDKWIEEGMDAPEDMDIAVADKLLPRIPGTAYEMFFHYLALRKSWIQECEWVHIERPFMVPLDANAPDIAYVGRLDKVVKYNGKVIVIEHKTTTAYKKDGPFRYEWMDSWSPNAQVDGYIHAAHMLYPDEDVFGVYIDGALVHKKIHDGFKYIPINRQLTQLDAWLYETKYWIKRIFDEEAKFHLADLSVMSDAPYLAAYPKQTDSCSHFAGCTYRDLCKAWGNPEKESCPSNFKEERWEPFVELNLSTLGAKPEIN